MGQRFHSFFIDSSLLTFLVYCSWPAPAAAQVSAVSGTVANGQEVTISGQGFGANGPTVYFWDDFEGGTVGAAFTNPQSAVIGSWFDNDHHPMPFYAEDFSLSGRKAMQTDCNADYRSAQIRFPGFPQGLSTNNDVFLQYWVYVPVGDVANHNGNWKETWFMGPNNSTHTGDYVIALTQAYPNQSNSAQQMLSCNGCARQGDTYGSSFHQGQWTRRSAYIKWRRDATGKRLLWEVPAAPSSWWGQCTYHPGDCHTHNIMKFNDQAIQLAPSSGTGDFWSGWNINAYMWVTDPRCNDHWDDIYVQTGPYAQARVELTDVRTYPQWSPNNDALAGDETTKMTVCSPTAWADGSVRCTVRQGNFVAGQTAYLFVVDAAGNVSDQDTAAPGAQGFEVQIGGSSGDTNPPSNPRNVRVLP